MCSLLMCVDGEGAGQHQGQQQGREWSTDNVNNLVVFTTLKIVQDLVSQHKKIPVS